MINALLQGTFNQKREARRMVARLPFSLVGAVTESFLVANLPANALITDAFIFAQTASNAATSDAVVIGTTDGGSEIMSAGNAKTAGKSGTFAGMTDTTTGKPVYVKHTVTGAKTAGELLVVIEYLEYERTNGEYTKV